MLRSSPNTDSATICAAHNEETYGIYLNAVELATINQRILSYPNHEVISKKIDEIQFPYSLLKTRDNDRYLIGKGKKGDDRNAFFGGGAFGRVKASVKLKESEDNHYELSREMFAVKICKQKDEKKSAFIATQRSEVEFFKIVYGFSDLILADEGRKAYQILLKIPGCTLGDVNYRELNVNDIVTLIANSFYAIVNLHQKNISHRDIKPDNVLFDEKSNNTYCIDFGLSAEITSDAIEDNDFKGYIGLIHAILLKYLISHMNNSDIIDGRRYQMKMRAHIRSNVKLITEELFKLDDLREALTRNCDASFIKRTADNLAVTIDAFLAPKENVLNNSQRFTSRQNQ